MKNSFQNSISFRRLITKTYKDVLVQVNGSMGPALPRGLYINAFIFSYFTECRGNVSCQRFRYGRYINWIVCNELSAWTPSGTRIRNTEYIQIKCTALHCTLRYWRRRCKTEGQTDGETELSNILSECDRLYVLLTGTLCNAWRTNSKNIKPNVQT
jgi:hypothetical protein